MYAELFSWVINNVDPFLWDWFLSMHAFIEKYSTGQQCSVLSSISKWSQSNLWQSAKIYFNNTFLDLSIQFAMVTRQAVRHVAFVSGRDMDISGIDVVINHREQGF